MTDLADLFPDFSSHWVDTSAGRIFARRGGDGPPLLLLHGFPQTHVMWHKIAPTLARNHTVVAIDLRGYGWSSMPLTDVSHRPYSKRAMAADAIEVMEALGHVRFAVVGHDRGGRVAYRLALDHPGRVVRLAVLDIIPTATMWSLMDAKRALRTYHWSMLAQPAPMPETLLAGAPLAWLDHTLASWTAKRSLEDFDPRALAHYRAAFNDPSHIHALCEDYRAGATVDREDDEADLAAGRRITSPTLALWGRVGIPAGGRSPGEIWADWATDLSTHVVEAGHFVAEEDPVGTLAALNRFLSST